MAVGVCVRVGGGVDEPVAGGERMALPLRAGVPVTVVVAAPVAEEALPCPWPWPMQYPSP